MKIHRLTRAELTEWRLNVHHLVDDAGHLVAVVDKGLEAALSSVTRSARSQRKSLQQRVSIGAGPSAKEYLIVVDVARNGLDQNDLTYTPSVDGHRVVSGKEVFCAKKLHELGECQLRAPNGVILKVVRNPDVHRPTFKESEQIAPKPEHCPCATWGHPHPGTHYPTCQFNRLAPPSERAPTDRIPEHEVRMLPTEAFSSLGRRLPPTPATAPMVAKLAPHSVPVEAAPLDAPESCRNECLKWATPKAFPVPAGQHHPTCHFAKPWAIKTAREVPRWLVDLNTGERVRTANDQEIGESEIAAARSGNPIIHIEEVPYAVVLQTELDAEDAETLAQVKAAAG